MREIAQLSIWGSTRDVEAPTTATELSGNFVPMTQQRMSLSTTMFEHLANSGWTGPMLSAWWLKAHISHWKKAILIQSTERKLTFLRFTSNFGSWELWRKLNCAMNMEKNFLVYGPKSQPFWSILLVKWITNGLHHHTEVGWLGQAAILEFLLVSTSLHYMKDLGKKINRFWDEFLFPNSWVGASLIYWKEDCCIANM